MSAQDRRNARIRAQEKTDKFTRATVLKALMSDKSGRRFVWLELAAANVFSQSQDIIASHAIMAFFEGKRSVGLRWLLEVTALHPEFYIMMVRENSGQTEEEEDGGSDSDD